MWDDYGKLARRARKVVMAEKFRKAGTYSPESLHFLRDVFLSDSAGVREHVRYAG